MYRMAAEQKGSYGTLTSLYAAWNCAALHVSQHHSRYKASASGGSCCSAALMRAYAIDGATVRIKSSSKMPTHRLVGRACAACRAAL